MKKVFFILFTLVTLQVSAQTANVVVRPDSLTTVVRSISTPKTEWLSPFSKVVVDGAIKITFKRVETDEQLKIVYDTKGDSSSRFRAGVDKNGILQIIERTDLKPAVIPTEVTVYYKEFDNISINHATATFEGVLECRLLDMVVKGGATVMINIKALDTLIECTGKSRLKIGGECRYFSLAISTAKMEGFGLKTVSSNIEASHEAEVNISVSERLEAVTSTSAKILYNGRPMIIRNRNTLFGGEILVVE